MGLPKAEGIYICNLVKKLGEQPKQLGGRRRNAPTSQTKAHCTDVMNRNKEKTHPQLDAPSKYVLRKRA